MKLVIAIAGASGAIYARRSLQLASQLAAGERAGAPREGLEVHWVASRNAHQVWRDELGEDMPEQWPATRRWANDDFGAPFASGSNAPDALLVAPCSMSTLSRVAHGGGGDLIARACDVALKERRRLILLARETPLSLVHLRNMVAATEAGATVMPAIPSFYAGGPGRRAGIDSLEGAVDSVIARAFDHVGIRLDLLPRWGDAS